MAAAALVGCGDAAANETCQQLQDLEEDVAAADAEDSDVNALVAETYTQVADLAETTDGELGQALTDLQPLMNQLAAMVGEDEQAAAQAQEALADQSEEEAEALDEAADYINQTCDLTMLL